MKNLIAILAATVLCGCKMDVKPEVYISDLRLITSGKEQQLLTPTMIAIAIPSSDECEKHSATIAKVLIGILNDYRFQGCTDEGMDSQLNLAVDIPLVSGDADSSITGFANTEALFYVSVLRLPTGPLAGNIALLIGLNPDKYSLLNERMSSEFLGNIDLADSTIQITLNNDERNPVAYWVQDAFVDQEPVQTRRKLSLRRREAVDIVLSNVGGATLERETVAYVAAIESG